MSELETRTMAKVTWRLVPFLMLCYFIAYLDRVNLGFAGGPMSKDLGFSASVFGGAAGIFFIAYFFFEVPSNLAFDKVGARLWIARIMFTWGLVAGAEALVQGAPSLFAVRFLLGIAEAGFFPGIIFYITLWFPSEYRSRIVGMFMFAIPISTVIGAPISGALLNLNGWMGLQGWQWMFVIEAVPALIMAFVVYFYLTDRPLDAHWLAEDERRWLRDRLASEAATREKHNPLLSPAGYEWRFVALFFVVAGMIGAVVGWLLFAYQGLGLALLFAESGVVGAALAWLLWRALPETVKRFLKRGVIEPMCDPRVIALGFVYMGCNIPQYGLSFFLPQIVKAFGLTNVQAGFVTALPYAVDAVGMILWSRHSDATKERMWHAIIPLLIIAGGLVAAALSPTPTIKMTFLCVAGFGFFSVLPVFWTLPTSFLSAGGAAAGIAAVNSIGNLGGYFGPQVFGLLKDYSGEFASLVYLAVCALIGAVIVFALGHNPALEQPTEGVRAAE